MNTKAVSSSASPKVSKKSPESTSIKSPQLAENPNLEDQFKAEDKNQGQEHLLEEQKLKIHAREQLHRAKMEDILTQLNLQLYKIWNEAWLQRQKTLDQGFKEWLKVFMA